MLKQSEPTVSPSAETEPEAGTAPAATAARQRPKQRSVWNERLRITGMRIAIIGGFLGLWELAVALKPDWQFWVSKPSLIFAELQVMLPTADFWVDVWVTLQEVVLGFVLGAVAGVVVGFVLGYFDRVYQVLQPIIFALYSLPRVALVPLFLLWFGIGLSSKVAIVISVVFFILLMNTYYGLQAIDKDLINNVRTMGASRWTVLRTVTLPSCASWILSGSRISISFALMSAIMAEMVASRSGLGNALMRTSGSFNTTGTFALLVVLAALAMVINSLMQAIQSRALHWQQVTSGAAGA